MEKYRERCRQKQSTTILCTGKKVADKSVNPKSPVKLTWKEKIELEGMEEKISANEKAIADLEQIFSLPDFFQKYGNKQCEMEKRLAELRQENICLYSRWEELEQKNTVNARNI